MAVTAAGKPFLRDMGIEPAKLHASLPAAAQIRACAVNNFPVSYFYAG